MAGNQTIIQAAKAAYTPHKVDYTPMIEAMGYAAESIAQLTKAAIERTNKINKDFTLAMGKQENEVLRNEFIKIRNDKSLSEDQKLTAVKYIKKDTDLLAEYTKNISKPFENNGAKLSKGVHPIMRGYHASLISQKFYGPNSMQDRNQDGVISDEESKIIPVKTGMVDGVPRLLILNQYGTDYITVDQLDDNFPSLEDGVSLRNDFEKTKKVPSDFTGSSTDINNWVNDKMDLMKSLIDTDPMGVQSFIHDQPLRIDSGELRTFREYYLDNYKSGVSSDEYEKIEKQIKTVIGELKESGKMSKEAEESFEHMLFLQLIEADDENVNDLLLEYMEKALTYKLKTDYPD
jgi:hypothetical protein